MSSEAEVLGAPGERPAPVARTQRGVTRADVARLAGVSTAVVSYVLNNGPRPVAEHTAARVREAMDLLGYRPNVSARALRLGVTRTLGLVVADSLNPYFVEYTAQLVRAAAAAGQRLLVADSSGDLDSEPAVVEELLARQVDGLLLATRAIGPDLRLRFRSDTVPVVLIDCPGPVPGYQTVGAAAMAGARSLVEHLIGVHGHRRIGLVIGESGYGSPDPRERGWRQALKRAGLPEGPVVRAPFSREGGYAAGRSILAADPRPEAIFASSDMQAIGLLRALHEQGLRIPGDVAVVSFDGTKESEFCWPPLTVARQPMARMAAAAIRLIHAPGDPAGQHVPLETDLVIRSSCGCSPA